MQYIDRIMRILPSYTTEPPSVLPPMAFLSCLPCLLTPSLDLFDQALDPGGSM